MWTVSRKSLGKGGIVSARVHPRIKQILRGAKQEAELRNEAIKRFNKRWRSWAIRTVRLQSLPRSVVLTADPNLMDSEYLAACMQKAACQGIKDINLWKGYSSRLQEILTEIQPLHFGLIMWSIGRVQLPLPLVYESLAKRAVYLIPDLTSNGLMATLWALRRALIVPPDRLLQGTADIIMRRPESIRPGDYIKICNSLAFFAFGKSDRIFRDKISKISVEKFESDTFAQDFRSAIDPLAMANLWNDDARVYILERFRKIFITARPNHLLSAYHASVVVRVLAPGAWFNFVSDQTRGFYTSLATRHISAPNRGMSKFHTDVSAVLEGDPFTVPHRNMFRWGPFWIDIGIETDDISQPDDNFDDDRKKCIVLDKPTSFFINDKTRYNQRSVLEHDLLSQVGWKVRHIHHMEWKKCRTRESKCAYLKRVLETETSVRLSDRT